MEETSLTQLGQHVRAPASPEEAVLERVPNPQAGTLYLARFTAPEFTSLCPVTGQPDFARLVIDYAPKGWLIESKSLKLYLGAFRNHGAASTRTAPLPSAAGSWRWPSPRGCASAVTGTPEAASRSTSSGKPAPRRAAFGCPTRAWTRTAAAEEI